MKILPRGGHAWFDNSWYQIFQDGALSKWWASKASAAYSKYSTTDLNVPICWLSTGLPQCATFSVSNLKSIEIVYWKFPGDAIIFILGCDNIQCKCDGNKRCDNIAKEAITPSTFLKSIKCKCKVLSFVISYDWDMCIDKFGGPPSTAAFY